MLQKIILAKNHVEAQEYIKLAEPGRPFRVATRASSIRGLRAAEVHVTNGFLSRPDRHPVLAELRYAKISEVFFADLDDLFGIGRRLHAAPAHDLDDVAAEMGVDLDEPAEMPGVTPNFTVIDETAHFDGSMADIVNLGVGEAPDEYVPTVVSDEIEELVTNSKERKRRYRCDVCSQLVWNDDDPAHHAGEHATQVALEESPVPTSNDFFA